MTPWPTDDEELQLIKRHGNRQRPEYGRMAGQVVDRLLYQECVTPGQGRGPVKRSIDAFTKWLKASDIFDREKKIKAWKQACAEYEKSTFGKRL